VLCSTGYNDPIPDRRCQEVQMVDAEGWRIGMIHSLGPPTRSMQQIQKAFPSRVDIIISGHTHYEALEYRDGVLLLNSGSITFPHNKNLRLGTIGLLELTSKGVHAEVVALGNSPGRPNPGKGMALDI